MSTSRRRYEPADVLAFFVNAATTSHRRAAALLVVFCLAAFLPGFFQIPPVDRDEARFAQATKQMIETGNYVDIRLQDEVRYKKPVGIYWLQAGVVKTAQAVGVPNALTTISLYRIPSLIGAIGSVLLTYWTALAFVPRRAAVLAGLMLASSILLGVEARLAKTDSMLLFTVTAAMGAMARVYLAREKLKAAASWILPAIFWTALAGGVMLKGPLIFMVVGLAGAALCVFERSARWLLTLRPLPGIAWLALLVLPWFIAIVGKSGDSFFAESVGHDLLAKITSGQETHGAPPGYYLVLFFVTFWPAAVLAAPSVAAVWAQCREPQVRYLLAWLVPSWLVFELVMTKLPHYVLPLYPAIAILIAGALERNALSRTRWMAHGTIGWFIFPTLLGLGGVIALPAIAHQLGVLAWPFILAAMIFGLFAWLLYDVDGAERALLRAALSSIFLAIAIYAVVFPTLRTLFPSAQIADALREEGCANPRAASAGYQEPSLVFLLGTPTVLTDGAGAAQFLRGGACRFALIDTRQDRSFRQRAETIGLRYAKGPRIDGFNIGGGRRATITVYRSEVTP